MSELLNLIRDFFTSLFTGNYRGSRKRRELKKVYRELRQKNPDYYRPHTNEVLPAFAGALHKWSQYIRFLNPLFEKTILCENARLAERFKDHLVEARLSEADRLKKGDFTYQAMKVKLAQAPSFKDCVNDLTAEFEKFLALFRQPEFAGCDEEIAQIERLAVLSRYPYEKLLSFFDPGIASGDRRYQPRFVPVLATQLTQDLMDLYFSIAECEAGPGTEENVVRLYHRLKKVPAEDEVEKLRKVIGFLDLLRRKYLSPQSLLCLIRTAGEDPNLSLPADREVRGFLELYKSKLLARFELDREKLIREHSEAAVASDLKRLFDGARLLEVTGYTEGLSEELRQEGFLNFAHVRPFQIVKSYVALVFERTAKEHVKQLVIDAFFENKPFKEKFISQFHETQSIPDRIGLFENSMAEKGEVSVAGIRAYLEKHQHGKSVSASLNQLVETVNDNAARLIEESVNAFSRFLASLGELLADAKSHAPTIISNIKVIGGDRNPELMRQFFQDREKMSQFIEIMKNFTVIRKSLARQETIREHPASARHPSPAARRPAALQGKGDEPLVRRQPEA